MVGSHGAKRTRIRIQMERQGTRPRIEIGPVAQGEYGVEEGDRTTQVSIEGQGGGGGGEDALQNNVQW